MSEPQTAKSTIEELAAYVYRTATQIVITGHPDEEDEQHNCDAMGCGYEHVLYRFPLPTKGVVAAMTRAEAR